MALFGGALRAAPRGGSSAKPRFLRSSPFYPIPGCTTSNFSDLVIGYPVTTANGMLFTQLNHN